MEKGDISKDLLEFLLVTGGVSLLLINPAFLVPAIFLARYSKSPVDRKKLRNAVSYLKSKKYISIKKDGKNTRVELTTTGKDKAILYSIQSSLLERIDIKKRNKWDGKWRIIIFDIEHRLRKKRDALRRVLKRSGFEQLQKSTWVYPFDCTKEVNLTKDFFKITDKECRIVTATDIGDDRTLRKKFGIS
jgi:DNA-binding transcriptional regulator PaaX